MLTALPSWAGFITVGNYDLNRGAYVDFQRNGSRDNAFAGVIQGFYDFGPLIDLLSADLYRHIGVGTFYSNRTPVTPADGFARIAWLYDYELTTATTPVLGAGLQLAIWDIMADGGDGLHQGYLQVALGTPAAVADAWDYYLTISVGQSSTLANFYINHNIEGVYLETLVGPGLTPPPPPPPPVPEPSTITLVIVSVALLGALKLRK